MLARGSWSLAASALKWHIPERPIGSNDLDVLVESSVTNAVKVTSALAAIGMNMTGPELTPEALGAGAKHADITQGGRHVGGHHHESRAAVSGALGTGGRRNAVWALGEGRFAPHSSGPARRQSRAESKPRTALLLERVLEGGGTQLGLESGPMDLKTFRAGLEAIRARIDPSRPRRGQAGSSGRAPLHGHGRAYSRCWGPTRARQASSTR